ncbi:MAG: hypothetical protein MJ197_04085 [Bacteroidales bacterium]|nr:hypothetical protein [Bacteroidales bacterium]
MSITRNILSFFLFFSVAEMLLGATYTTKSSTNPGYKFQESDSWTVGICPGAMGATTWTIDLPSDIIEIEGYVALNTGLDITSKTLKLKENSILVIDGDFKVSDYTDIVLEKGSTLYVKGDFRTIDKTTLNLVTYVNINKNANVVVEGNLYSENFASVNMVVVDAGNCDFYVFGEKSGVILKSKPGMKIENEDDFNNAEQVVAQKVSQISQDLLSDCTLHIHSGETLTVKSGEHIIVCGIDMEYDGELIIENGGVLTIQNDFIHTKGKITNYGTINGINIEAYPAINNGKTCELYNNGTINAENVSFGTGTAWNTLANSTYLGLSCGSVINASESIKFYVNQPYFKASGVMVANDITIHNTDGYNYSGNLMIESCADIKATEALNVSGNVNQIKLYGHIIAGSLNSEKNIIVSDDNQENTSGTLTIGDLENNVKILVDENSTLNLCFNPTVSSREIIDEDKPWIAHVDGADALGGVNGYVLYLANTETGYSADGKWTPVKEQDLNAPSSVDGNAWMWQNYTAKEIPAYKTKEECLSETRTIFLSISSEILKKENEYDSLYDYNPCSKEYDKAKVRIRELSNKWFRVINGDLYYCEGDNE